MTTAKSQKTGPAVVRRREALPPPHRPRRLGNVLTSAAKLLPLCWLGLSVHAQPYTLDWFTVDGGGGVSSGGSYTLVGTIGQPDAGMMRGSSFTLEGGFWPGMAVPLPVRPTLFIQLSGDAVIISWSPALSNFTLETTPGLDPPSWTVAPSGTANPANVPISDGAHFYRLRQQ